MQEFKIREDKRDNKKQTTLAKKSTFNTQTIVFFLYVVSSSFCIHT